MMTILVAKELSFKNHICIAAKYVKISDKIQCEREKLKSQFHEAESKVDSQDVQCLKRHRVCIAPC